MCLARPRTANMRFAATTTWSGGSTVTMAAHTGGMAAAGGRMAAEREVTATVRLRVEPRPGLPRVLHQGSCTGPARWLPAGATDRWQAAAAPALFALPAEDPDHKRHKSLPLPHIAAAADR